MKINNSKIALPILLTDGGLETTLIFENGIDLPHFACFQMLDQPQQAQILKDYFRPYLDIAHKQNTGFVLESPTWRANKNWGYKLGYTDDELGDLRRRSIEQLQELKAEYADKISPIIISGNIGPGSDGYVVTSAMTTQESRDYHDPEVEGFKKAGADQVTALTINYMEEGYGIVLSAMEHNIDVIVSFTVETDGKLPDGENLGDVIEFIDSQTKNYPSYYMINCAHPSHFMETVINGGRWTERIRGIRANASCKSHAELDESTELDAGNRVELAGYYKELLNHLPNLQVFGGCCGTDHSHIETICESVLTRDQL